MTTSHSNLSVSLADLDQLLPAPYAVLSSDDARNDQPYAMRTIWNEATMQTQAFPSAQAYLQFVVSVAQPHPLLAEEGGTRYLLLSAQYDADPYFYASVTHTVAALTRSSVILHRLKSDETSMRFVLSQEEMAALIAGYQAFQAECEGEAHASTEEFDPFLANGTTEQENGGER